MISKGESTKIIFHIILLLLAILFGYANGNIWMMLDNDIHNNNVQISESKMAATDKDMETDIRRGKVISVIEFLKY